MLTMARPSRFPHLTDTGVELLAAGVGVLIFVLCLAFVSDNLGKSTLLDVLLIVAAAIVAMVIAWWFRRVVRDSRANPRR
jgi:hypothetical protein